VTPTTVPPTTGPPTTVPPTTVPPVTPKVRVKDKVRAGTMLKVRGRDLPVRKVSITLGGKKLGTAKVTDGRFVVTRMVPKSLKGRTVLRVLDRKGEVLVRATVRVMRRKAA
jgi:expansin (peptidoglycan-binding protein)